MEGFTEGNALQMEEAGLGAKEGAPLVDDGVKAEGNKTGSTVIGAINS